MAKQLQVYVLVILSSFALTCTATTYVVGGTSGWDISTDLDAWAQGKTFFVGDVLLFQLSSSSLDEVTQENFNKCNTSNVLKSYVNGNTTVILSKPGPRYFISGKKLYCFGGMKLQVNVEDNNIEAYSPASAPQPAAGSDQGATFPQPNSKSDIPSTSGRLMLHGGWHTLMSVSPGLMATVLLWVVRI